MSCPSLLQQSQTFVARAAAEAETAVPMAGEAEAGWMLEQVRQRIYFWQPDFGGFRCQLQIVGEGGPWSAVLVAASSRDFRFEEVRGCPQLTRWAHYQVGEILGHREHPSRSKMASRSGVRMGDDDPIYGRRLDFVGDRLASYYRVKDLRITQIARTYAGQSFVICIDRHHSIQDRFVASNYTAYYSDPDGSLVKVENYQDDYLPLPDHDHLWLPSERRFTVVEGSRREHRSLQFTRHELLATS